MPYITSDKILKTNSLSLFLLFIVLGIVSLSVAVLMGGKGFQWPSSQPAPIASAAVEMIQKPLSSDLSVIQAVPAVPVQPLVENIDQKAAVVIQKSVQKKEARLKIPKIGVDAAIKEMGLTSDGAMAVPSNRFDVGWYKLGTRLGKKGSAVIGGHNVWDSGPGVFVHLDQLQKGDVLSVVDAKGISISFVVQRMHTYDATDTDSGIFDSKSGVHLNLITCSGKWDPKTKSYTKRLVIFTDLIN